MRRVWSGTKVYPKRFKNQLCCYWRDWKRICFCVLIVCSYRQILGRRNESAWIIMFSKERNTLREKDYFKLVANLVSVANRPFHPGPYKFGHSLWNFFIKIQYRFFSTASDLWKAVGTENQHFYFDRAHLYGALNWKKNKIFNRKV